METIILVVHILIALSLVALVLIQQGKGADTGASFGGGASGTVFGSSGGATFFTKLTTALAISFFATSLALAMFSNTEAKDEGLIIVPVAEVVPAQDTSSAAAVESEVPVIDEAANEMNAADESVPVIEETEVPVSE